MKAIFKISLASVFIFLIAIGCRKDNIITEKYANISFSTDTVYFDTVLVTLGSITQRFKIYNKHNKNILIQEIYLAGGNKSFYRMNVDGESGNAFKDIELHANDSLYVFVEVTVDPQESSSPVIIEDSIFFIVNGNVQDVNLFAYGQDVVIFRNKVLKTQTWTHKKPYLIINNTAIDEKDTLFIEPGTRVFLHNNSSLLVLGRLEARGTLDNPILFTSDRFDKGYEGAAGQWGTIFIHPESNGASLEHVIIKNANAGIQIGYPNPNKSSSLELINCMILNSASLGIYAFGSKITAYNTIIADCGMVSLGLFMGGTYNFYHCTFNNVSAHYPSASDGYRSRNLPSLVFSNNYDWYTLNDDFWVEKINYPKDIELNFYNSILYGTNSLEIKYDSVPAVKFQYLFDHTLIKNHKDSLHYSNTNHFSSIILNKDPKFLNDSVAFGEYNFQLDTLSPAKDKGDINIVNNKPVLQFDLNGKSRIADGKPDMGAYERYE